MTTTPNPQARALEILDGSLRYTSRHLGQMIEGTFRHQLAMTAEGLHSKAEIAEELAARDNELRASIDRENALRAEVQKPIDMILHCPACGVQHIDAPSPDIPGIVVREGRLTRVPCVVKANDSAAWTNPPHRSHLCHGCGHIWRPADVPTNGVRAIQTKGKADSPMVQAVTCGIRCYRCRDTGIQQHRPDVGRPCPDCLAPPAQPASAVVPDGWQLVPKEPTTEMVDAMNRVQVRHNTRQYLAALAAAPKPEGN